MVSCSCCSVANFRSHCSSREVVSLWHGATLDIVLDCKNFIATQLWSKEKSFQGATAKEDDWPYDILCH